MALMERFKILFTGTLDEKVKTAEVKMQKLSKEHVALRQRRLKAKANHRELLTKR